MAGRHPRERVGHLDPLHTLVQRTLESGRKLVRDFNDPAPHGHIPGLSCSGASVRARIMHDKTPNETALFVFGDAAQGWPMAASAWNEFLMASAGPFANVLLSGLAYLLWNAQIKSFSISWHFL